MTKANAFQFGGIHYKTEYEHWDLVLRCGLGYLEGCATKYITRWQKKSSFTARQDLQKAWHFVVKMLENVEACYPHQRKNQRFLRAELAEFLAVNKLQGDDLAAVVALVTWETRAELETAKATIEHIMQSFPVEAEVKEAQPVPAEDSNKHAERA